jgi:hypothetical protein
MRLALCALVSQDNRDGTSACMSDQPSIAEECTTVASRYYEACYSNILVIMISYLYHKHYQTI